MADDQTFSTSARWAPPIIVAAIVGLVPALVMGIITNNQQRENELTSFLRAERVKAYSNLTATLSDQDNLVAELLVETYNADEHSDSVISEMKTRINAQDKIVSAAHAQVQVVGDDKVIVAANEVVSLHNRANSTFITILSENLRPTARLVKPNEAFLSDYLGMITCNNDQSSYYFSLVANADLRGAETGAVLPSCPVPENYMPDGVEAKTAGE